MRRSTNQEFNIYKPFNPNLLMSYQISKRRKMSEFVQRQREERFAFSYQQHKASLAFRAKQIKERQTFIERLEGGDVC